MAEQDMNTDEQSLLRLLFADAQAYVRAFVASESFASAASAAFGASAGAVASVIRQFDGNDGWSRLATSDDNALNGGRAAYVRSSDTIVIDRKLLTSGASALIVSALVEEIGHAIDARLNDHDTPGDEGAIFAQFVLGQPPSASELAALRADHDHGTITVNGKETAAEFAGETIGSITLDGNLADWIAADQIDQSLSVSGYDIYAKAAGASYVFALKAPVAIGATTTAWLNTDQNASTGYQIWGFAGGAEYNINFDATGTPRLYTGADGQTLVTSATVAFGYSADRTIVEFAIDRSAIGSAAAINTLWDINNNTFLPTSYSATQYTVAVPSTPPAPVVGSVTLDGNLTEWAAADAIDQTLSTSGYDIYARATGGSFVFALKAPVAIGADTTAWLNTDQNAATGFQIFGSTGGAEYNINFDAGGVPRLYTGNAGQTLVPGVAITHTYSADRTVVEFAVQTSALGSPVAVNTLWDVNNSTFLPSDYATTQYQVLNNLPARTDFSDKIGIVYSETTANQYFSKTAYSQLFAAAQNQAMMAGVPFDILTESDLTNLAKLANYDALLFPSLQNVKVSELPGIENTLKLLTQNYNVSLIASGNFMTNSETGAALSGDSYARMKSLLGVQPVTGGFPADVTVRAGDVTHPMMQDYAAGETIHTYTGTGWLAFAPVTGTGTSVLATQTVGGQTYNAVMGTSSGGDRNVHFSSDAVMADKNLLWQAIDYAVNGAGVTAGLQLSRQASLVASRVDMDQAMEMFDVNPANGAPGIYDTLLPILQDWKTNYNFVGSYYIDIGDNLAEDQGTDWAVSGPYYSQLLALGNELGSHTISHPHFTDQLTPAQIQYKFQGSRQIIEQQMSAVLGRPFTVEGVAVPGAPESLATALAISQYYNYLSGGFSSIGAGYPGAIGYLTPEMAAQDKVYLAPNLQFDFSLVEFRGLTPTQAALEWQQERAALTTHSDVPVLLWPWHDYGAAAWPTNPPAASPYNTAPAAAMFTDFISKAYVDGAEFVTLDDLAQRVSTFEDSTLVSSVSGNTISATVSSPSAGKFALDLDNLGTQKIARVTGWYAYDADSVFLPQNGGTYTIQLGAAADDVTHITSLPMRAELRSLTGNGTNLSFSLFGEGRMMIDLVNPAGRAVVVTGANVVSLSGDQLTLDVGAIGQHDVSVTLNVVNQAPTITSNGGGTNAAITLAENALAVTTVAATDPNVGQALTYLISGGADAARFAINAQSGALTFNAAPDFEVPADQGANNVYDVIVTARDSALAADTQAIAVTITNVGGLTLTGNASANTLTGAGEEDTLSGAGGNDVLSGLGGNDTLNGGAGTDTASYSTATTGVTVSLTVTGAQNTVGAGTDTLVSIENLLGSALNDTLTGNGVANLLRGAGGNDTLIATVDDVRDTLEGGANIDTASYTAYAAALTVNLAATAPILVGGSGSSAANNDVLVGIENFIGGSGNDTLTGNGSVNVLTGGAGNDTINGAGGNDTLDGGDGDDILNGGANSDILIGGAGRDRFDYNAINEGLNTITDFARGTSGDMLDIKDVLVGYVPGSSNVNAFVRLAGTSSTTVSVNADGAGTDFVALATLQNIAMSSTLLNELLATGNLVVS